jgi:GGDEF domain-containing protein/ActR/RegA family two-component response regulator
LTPLTIVAIVDQEKVADLFRRVFAQTLDRLLLTGDLAEGLALAASESPHVAFVDVSLGRNAGLALVHHIRAVAPAVAVYALADASALAVGAQAAGLGGAGLIMMPPSGDELLTAVSEARARLETSEEMGRLTQEVNVARRGTEVATAVAALAECADRAEAAKKLGALFAEATSAKAALVYLFASEGSSELLLAGGLGTMPAAPSFVDQMGLMTFARHSGCELVPLSVRHLSAGHVLLWGLPKGKWGPSERLAAELIAGQAATTLALIEERERSTRGAMKDQTTSAYTFAYFVDIAGREIDKARRYGRRFALATVTIDDTVADGSELVEVVLGAVRDTDVLARVDDREFYLLMPETGGVGAQSCRRRVLQAVAARAGRPGGFTPAGLTMGVATYPHDGTDLSKLLRHAKRRADVSKSSVVRTLKLEALSLPDLVDELLLHGPSLLPPSSDFGGARPIGLTLRDAIAIALSAAGEAMRGGPTLVAVAHHPELGLSSSVRAAFGQEREGLALHILDLRAVPRCGSLQFLTVIGEHGSYVLVGRSDGAGLTGVHGSDPLLVDLVTMRSGQSVGVRLLD